MAWENILKSNRIIVFGKKPFQRRFLFVTPSTGYPFIPNDPVWGDKSGRAQKKQNIKPMNFSTFKRQYSRLK